MSRIFLEKMIERKKGHVVAISSMSALQPLPWAVLYSTSKAAVTCFMESLRQQLRLDGHEKYIHTTCIMPYFINDQAYKDTLQSR
jgi:all-trans-retinol dehydrogenase (NAD+)